jgi:flagellar hook-basal body complex protein FliE
MAIGPINPYLPAPPIFRPPTTAPGAAGDAGGAALPVVPGPRTTTTPQIGPNTGATPSIDGPGTAANSFSKLLSDAVGQIDQLQKGADLNVQKLATGQDVDMHDVTISVEQANLGFQLGVQVRNKLIEAYQEVMRMQV